MLLAAVGAFEAAHVLNDAEHRNVHKLCYVNGLGHDHGHQLLRRGDDNDAVNWAVANGITNGTGNGRFPPNDTCTRAQVVTFLYRAQ